MNAYEKRQLAEEARLQSDALRRIGRWRTAAMGVSSVGIALIYAGFIAGQGLLMGIAGVILLLLGIGGALILNLGIRNGRRNVEKILEAIASARDSVEA